MRVKYLVVSLTLVAMFLSFTMEAKSHYPINVASYNLRMDTPNDGLDAWPNRKDMVNELIRYHNFDIIGTQEGFKHQLEDIVSQGDYSYIGVGRDDGADKGEHSAIIYKKDRLEVLESGNFWFSETPDKPGKGWDAKCCNRICSWAKFKDLESGKEFFFFNVHYDHEGVKARRESSLLLLKKIKEVEALSLPVILTGDFNADPESEPIKILRDSEIVHDSYSLTEKKPYGPVGTYNGFDIKNDTSGRIDYVWVTEGVKVLKYGVLTDNRNGRLPSDHYPVYVRLVL
ncbi:MAG: endonuclease/exonuclease/phosphatase family protein [Fermentimonas sp.]|jgi:endonuclease/exonuclease/phosphatase family metal-dependent hydrolase